jgi:hypothetical protein
MVKAVTSSPTTFFNSIRSLPLTSKVAYAAAGVLVLYALFRVCRSLTTRAVSSGPIINAAAVRATNASLSSATEAPSAFKLLQSLRAKIKDGSLAGDKRRLAASNTPMTIEGFEVSLLEGTSSVPLKIKLVSQGKEVEVATIKETFRKIFSPTPTEIIDSVKAAIGNMEPDARYENYSKKDKFELPPSSVTDRAQLRFPKYGNPFFAITDNNGRHWQINETLKGEFYLSQQKKSGESFNEAIMLHSQKLGGIDLSFSDMQDIIPAIEKGLVPKQQPPLKT